MHINFTLQFPVQVKKRSKCYSSLCPILDVHSVGGTEKEALDNLIEAVRLFLSTCIEGKLKREVQIEKVLEGER